MVVSSTNRDPRSIVTPDAFEVSPGLLGLRLAAPGRRLLAILLDLIAIGVLTALTRSFALILGVVAAVVFVRAGFKRTQVRGSVFGRAMRASVGCLGIVIGLVTAILWVAFGPSVDRGGPETPEVPGLAGTPAGGVLDRALGSVAELAVASAFDQAETLDDAEDALEALMDGADELGLSRDRLRSLALASVPADASWADEGPTMIARLLPAERETIESRDLAAIEDEVSMYGTAEALGAYATLLESGRDGEMDVARLEALRRRLAGELAADSLGVLEARLADLEDDRLELRGRLADTRAELEEVSGSGLFGGLMDFIDELGFGFGWASIYLTVMLSWWNGQTPGKRLVGIRVVRLDGEPINWWTAFERAGGYAAGFATGLLGFAQVYWDSNRQAIHDRIVGTVVVVDGAEKVLDWESAL